jgi:L-lactate dehydrogenase complex protein LldG
MSAARSAILDGIRSALGGTGVAAPAGDERAQTIPSRARPARPVAAFVDNAERAGCTVERVADVDAVPAAVAAYLARHDLGVAARRAPEPFLETIPWPRRSALAIETGPVRDGDRVAITAAAAGVAETGTLVLSSGRGRAILNAFLPEAHIVILGSGDVVGSYEESWTRLGAAGADKEWPPRAVTWVTGPSRTADIEQTLIVGVHGPRRVHVIVVGDEA